MWLFFCADLGEFLTYGMLTYGGFYCSFWEHTPIVKQGRPVDINGCDCFMGQLHVLNIQHNMTNFGSGGQGTRLAVLVVIMDGRGQHISIKAVFTYLWCGFLFVTKHSLGLANMT